MEILTPRNAKTFKQLCSLKTDSINSKTSWLLIDQGTIYIHNQKSGEKSTGAVVLSRRDFNRFIDWYNGVEKKRKR